MYLSQELIASYEGWMHADMQALCLPHTKGSHHRDNVRGASLLVFLPTEMPSFNLLQVLDAA